MSDWREGEPHFEPRLQTPEATTTAAATSRTLSPGEARKRALVVLGMHRSGTSAITRVCNLLGADLPRNLLPADSHNEPGYWEPQSVKLLNDELLTSVGSSWDDALPFPVSWFGTRAADEFQRRAVDALSAEYRDSPLFVLKDPRICRLVPFWLSVLTEFGADPVFLISARNPLEVAASLKKRDGLSQSFSLLLWLRHVLEAELGSRGSPRCVVRYEDLLADPRRVVHDFSSRLPINWPQPWLAADGAISGFLNERLRHHRMRDQGPAGYDQVSVSVREIYTLLRANIDSEFINSRFDAIRETLDGNSFEHVPQRMAPGLANRDKAGNTGDEDQEEAAARDRSQPHSESTIQRVMARIDELESRTASLQRAVQYESERARLADHSGEQEQRIKQLEAGLRDHAARIGEEASRADRLSAELTRVEESAREAFESKARTEAALKDRTQESRYLLGQLGLLQQAQPFQIGLRRSWVQRLLGGLFRLCRLGPRNFDPDFYLARNIDVADAGHDPLVHFLFFGRKEGRRYNSDEAGFSGYADMALIQQSGLFDHNYYVSRNPDVIAAGKDPVEHFLTTGAWESRMPSPQFDPAFYLASYPDVKEMGVNPLVHYLRAGRFGKRSPLPPAPALAEHLPQFLAAEPAAPEEEVLLRLGPTDIRLIAFYLPQFHPFPENDRFWGKGFTEWTNVTRAKAIFLGHHQPRLPGELGFYDLRVRDVQRRQVELAKAHGISGFCYHYYWFDGKPVMERPLDQMLDDPSLDLPFCLHWANEPWTSSWDGCNQEGILLHQSHSPQDDIDFIRGIQRALVDSRYIRLNGRPLLAIYRPGLFPDMKATVERWRNYCAKEGIGDLYLVATQQPFDGPVDPRAYGFDAAVEFPPHNLPMVDASGQVEIYDPRFAGQICSYPEVVRASLGKPVPGYKLFRGIMPGFDNTARRQNSAVYIGNAPDIYQEWLEGLCGYTRKHLPQGERLIFINAWNEWAEGAYLEPDNLHGFAFLNRTARALRNLTDGNSSRKVIFVGHDAVRAGAQVLLLDMLRWVRESTATEVRLILGKGGDLLESYKEITQVLILDDLPIQPANEREERIREFTGETADLVYANTVVSGEYLPDLNFLGAPVVTHIHELEQSIRKFASAEALNNAIERTHQFIAASKPVADNLIGRHGVSPGQIETVCEFIRPIAPIGGHPAGRDRLRLSLGVEETEVAIISCGTRDWRKGPDIFVDVAEKLLNRGISNFKCFWIGARIGGEYADLESSLAGRGLSSHVNFLGEKTSVRDYFAAADIFLLPSREDPYPLVCLEAADCGLPTVCFAGAGGMPDFVEDDAGIVVPFEDVEAMTEAVARLIADRAERLELGSAARRKLRQRHTTETTMPEIFHIMREVSASPPLVSVIIPSYNYEQYLEPRLESIFKQTFQDFEIIVEDDCSTDGTLALLSRYESTRNLRVVRHDENRGVFAMWSEGLKAASGKIIWIAEEDDLCDPRFLEKLLPSFDDDRIQLAYCQSNVIDGEGSIVGDYTHCFPEFSDTKWTTPYVRPVETELRDGLAAKNFILNASGVLFRKPDPNEAASILKDFSVAGDWRLYLHVLEGGYIAYCPEKLNYHRRHPQSVIGKKENFSRLVAEAGKIHRHVKTTYLYNKEFIHTMSMHWLALWRERNTDASEREFWEIYGPHREEDVSETSALALGD